MFEIHHYMFHLGAAGTVVEVRVLSRRGVEKDERAITIEKQQIEKMAKDRDDEIEIIDRFVFMRLQKILDGPNNY